MLDDLPIAGALFEHAAGNHFLDHDTEELYGKMELVRGLLVHITGPDAMARLPSRIAEARFGHPGIAITIAARDGTVLSSTGPAQVVKHLLSIGDTIPASMITWLNADRTYRIVANRLALGIPGSAPVTVAIALDITDDQVFMTEFKEALWFGLAFAMLVMAVLG